MVKRVILAVLGMAVAIVMMTAFPLLIALEVVRRWMQL